MVELIARTRREISDESVPPLFTDEDIQDALDEHAVDIRYERTRALETRTAAGVSYLEHTFRDGRKQAFFSSDVKILNASYAELTTEAADFVNGKWTLAASEQIALILGTSYCVFAAGADLAEQWAAKFKLKSDFMDSGLMIRYGQRHDQIVALAARLRKRGRKGVRKGKLISTDFCATRF
jgi:hypothetical protein